MFQLKTYDRPGVTTDDIDAKVHDAIVAAGAYPSPLNYFGFPKSICSSVNEVVIHGIPDDRPLREGDIAKFDISLYYQVRVRFFDTNIAPGYSCRCRLCETRRAALSLPLSHHPNTIN